MSAESVLTACLKNVPELLGIPVRPGLAEAEDVAPYIVYKKIIGRRPNTLCGDCGLGNLLFQIDVYALTEVLAGKLRKLIFDAVLASVPLNAIFLEEDSLQELDTKLYRHRQKFSFWFYD